MVDTPSDLTTCLAISGGDTFGRTMSALEKQIGASGNDNTSKVVRIASRKARGLSVNSPTYMVCGSKFGRVAIN